MLNLTNEILALYIGGQLEVQNISESYIYRGEIKVVRIENNEVQIILEWMAKGEGYPPLPLSWIYSDSLVYAADLDIYSVSNIGPCSDGGDDRICLQSAATGEVTILFPSNGSKLDRSQIK